MQIKKKKKGATTTQLLGKAKILNTDNSQKLVKMRSNRNSHTWLERMQNRTATLQDRLVFSYKT